MNACHCRRIVVGASTAAQSHTCGGDLVKGVISAHMALVKIDASSLIR